jgi:hypothetical protein
MLVELSKNELFILQSALNYMSAAEEQQLRQQYGDVVRLYDKLKNISNACTCKEDSNV